MFGYACRDCRRAHAAAHLPGPPAGASPERGPQGRRPQLPAPRRQEPGDGQVRRRQARVHHRGGALHAARRRHRHRHAHAARPHRARHQAGPARRACTTRSSRRPSSTSTPRASSSSAAPWATPASPAARSSWTPTAAAAGTAAAPSRAKTRPRSTARPPTRPATWPRTSWPPAWPTAAKSQIAYAIGVAHPVSVMVDTLRHREGRARRPSSELVLSHFDLRPAAIIRDLQAAAAHLREDRRLRPLRPRRRRLHVGEHRQSRGAAQRRGAVAGTRRRPPWRGDLVRDTSGAAAARLPPRQRSRTLEER